MKEKKRPSKGSEGDRKGTLSPPVLYQAPGIATVWLANQREAFRTGRRFNKAGGQLEIRYLRLNQGRVPYLRYGRIAG